jgi:hypothetical protein
VSETEKKKRKPPVREEEGHQTPQCAFVKNEGSRVIVVPTTKTAYVARKELREPEKTRKKKQRK